MAMYKVRRRKDGKFSAGGLYPLWTENGVRWSSLYQLKLHMDEALKRDENSYRDSEVVEVREEVIRVLSPFELFDAPPDATYSETKKYEGGRKVKVGKERKQWTRQK